MHFGFGGRASFGWRYASVILLDNALTVGVDNEGRLYLPLVVLELESIVTFLRHLDPCEARCGAATKSAVFLENCLRCKALRTPYAVVVMMTFRMLLTVKKPAKIFDIAVVGDRTPCNEHEVVRRYVFTLHLAYIKNGYFSIFKGKNINGNVV